MKKLSLIAALLICGTSVFAANSTIAESSSSQSGMMMDSGKMCNICNMDKMSPKQREDMMKKWQDMTPEQKQMMQDRMQKHWSTMDADQKKIAMDRMMMKYNAMPSDDQKAMMQMMHDAK